MHNIETISSNFVILDQSPIGYFILQKDFVVLYWNQCIEDWTEISPGRIVGKKINDFFPHLTEPKYYRRLQTIFEGGPPVIFSSQLHPHLIPSPMRDNKFRIQHTTVTALPSSDEVNFHALFAIQDVTDLTNRIKGYRKIREQNRAEIVERKRIQKALHQAYKELEQKVQERTVELSKANQHLMQEIDERREAQNVLMESEERYRKLFEGAGEGIIVADIATKEFKYANPAICRILGYTEVELKRKCVPDIHPKGALEHVISEFEAQAKGEKTLAPNIPCLRKDGKLIFADITTATVLIDARECNVGFFTDITERRQAEEALQNAHDLLEIRVKERTAELTKSNQLLKQEISEHKRTEKVLQESEKRFRELFEGSPVAIFVEDFDGKILDVNQAACRLHGMKRSDLIGSNVQQLVPPGNKVQVLRNFNKMTNGKTENFEGLSLTKKGHVIPVELMSNRIKYAGKPAILLHVTDITERKNTQEELKKYREHLEEIVEDRTYELRKANEQLKKEIIERKQAEQALHKSHNETKHLLSSISSILIGVDQNHQITRWNSVADSTFKIPAANVVGKPFSKCKIQWDWRKMKESISHITENKIPTQIDEIRYTRPDGKEGFLSITLNPIVNDANEPTGFLLLAVDITERKILESLLAQAQKLESIGQLAAGIAHEINTPIQYVGDNTHFLGEAFGDLNILLDNYNTFLTAVKERKVTDEMVKVIETSTEEADLEYLLEEIPSAIEQSLDGIKRVAKIVLSMKEFSHPGEEAKTAIDINKAIESTITVSHNEWKYVADLVTDFDPKLPLVQCFPGEINQVILNIIINAIHAIADVVGDGSEKKGCITISTRSIKDWIEIYINDTGSGIPEEARPKIFDPFFTTKEIGKGSGQGLAISHNVLVNKHSGTFTFETEMGKGTTFIIRLPLSNAVLPQ